MEQLYVKKPSSIHGTGLFTTRDIPMGVILFKVINKECTQVSELGRWINHHNYPNTTLHKMNDGWYLVSVLPIPAGCEIVANYESSPPCVEKADPSWEKILRTSKWKII